MSRVQRPSVLIVALRVVITLLFVPAIFAKLSHPSMWAHLFTTWGYPPWGALVVNVIEIIGLIALWISPVAIWARAALMITTAGATGTWMIHGPRIAGAYPGTIFVLVGLLTWLSQDRESLMTRSPA
jgi:hypothetical protein